jgi:hypothetical protein
MVSLTRSFGKHYITKYCWTINYLTVIDIDVWLRLNGMGIWLWCNRRDSLFIFIRCCMLLFEYARRRPEKEILLRAAKALDKIVPVSIPRASKSTRDAASLSRR